MTLKESIVRHKRIIPLVVVVVAIAAYMVSSQSYATPTVMGSSWTYGGQVGGAGGIGGAGGAGGVGGNGGSNDNSQAGSTTNNHQSANGGSANGGNGGSANGRNICNHVRGHTGFGEVCGSS